MPISDIWQGFLEENPELYFQSMIPSGTQSFSDYWRKQYGNVYNQYQGALGKQVLGGGMPTLNFGDYLNQYPFAQYFNQMSPSNRGINLRALSPGLRWGI